jgi:hypothetical protein
MMRALAGLLAGLVFGLGLVVSGMSNPAKVLNFLDIAGTWDPSLIFVMGGALVVTFVGYRFVLGMSEPILEHRFHVPDRSDVDARLLTGAALFGVGWGIGGYCPGPAVTSATLGGFPTLVFLGCMLAGMLAVQLLQPRSLSSATIVE